MNITDVGHLTDDGDQGEDKMEKWAKKEGVSVRDIARKYEDEFRDALSAFAIEPFDVMPRATEYIWEQIQMIKTLINKWYTYIIPWDGIYMDTCKIDDYGKLAHLDITGLCSHYRDEGASIDSSKKRQITDFALWKFSPVDKQRAMEWIFDGSNAGALIVWEKTPSERKGKVVYRKDLNAEEQKTRWFPWWHIECSAMSSALLGKQFDIHTGWVDHIPVHHTNEIVQSECALWVDKWVNYRMHQQFLNVDGGKMSKSKGHDLSVKWILAKGYDPLDVRYFYLTAHYRSFLDFSRDALDTSAKTRKNLIKKLFMKSDEKKWSRMKKWNQMKKIYRENGSWWELYEKLCELMGDDLNTVEVLALMHQSLHHPSSQDIEDILLFDDQITKLWLREGVEQLSIKSHQEIPNNIKNLAEQRLIAKQEKDRARADALRDELKNLWWEVKDTAQGYELEEIL